MYNILIRPIARRLNPARANKLALRYFRLIGKIPGMRFLNRILHNNAPRGYSREVFGLNFYNPIGLGAGLDIRGELYNDLNDLGFSFTEIGPLGISTVRETIRNIQNDSPDDILAICIDSDFQTVFSLAYDFCDFFVIDLTTHGLVHREELFDPLLQSRLCNDIYKPLVVKLPDNVDSTDLEALLKYCMMNGIDGIEARNLRQIRQISEFCGSRLPIIANCHTKKPGQVRELLEAGASLVEIRNGLVTEGPSLIRKTLKLLANENRE